VLWNALRIDWVDHRSYLSTIALMPFLSTLFKSSLNLKFLVEIKMHASDIFIEVDLDMESYGVSSLELKILR
jgi:hypothetical protein